MEVLLIPIESKLGDVASIQNTAKFLETLNTVPAENTLLLISKANAVLEKVEDIKTTVGITRDTKVVEWLEFNANSTSDKAISQVVDGIRKLIIEDTKKEIKRMIIYTERRAVISVILWAEKNNLYRSDIKRDKAMDYVASGSVISIKITVSNESTEVRKRVVKEIFSPL